MKTVLLFAYGTLRKGESNDIYNIGEATFVSRGRIHGRLYDLGHCPAMLLSDSVNVAEEVHGEIYEIPLSMLEALDSVEDGCGDFRRQVVKVNQGQFGLVDCIVYFSTEEQVAGYPPISCGDWIQHRISRDSHNNTQWIYPVGDSAVGIDVPLLVDSYWKNEIDVMSSTTLAASIAAWLKSTELCSLSDIVPSYDAITIHFNSELREKTLDMLHNTLKNYKVTQKNGKIVRIPVCYGSEYGQDLENVARQKGMDKEEIIALHTAPLYSVTMIGFLPGFPYLEGLDSRLATPRLPTPRMAVDAGSIGIGGNQTGIYPHRSPGGWNLIGSTGVKLFSTESDQPCLLEPGDKVQFVPVDIETHQSILGGATWL